MKPWLALLLFFAATAQAAVVGFVQSPEGRVDLHDDIGVCVAGAKRAVYTPTTGDPIPGCWVFVRGVIHVAFFDGDTGQIPVQALKKPGEA